MTTVYMVQDYFADGGEVAGIFSTREKAEEWMKAQPPHVTRDWEVFPCEIDKPTEKDEEKIKANLEAKGHSFIFDPHHRCAHCGLLMGPLQELEERALISDLKVTAPRCQPIKTHDSFER